MDFENYLAEEKLSIIAINRISQIIYTFINENYYNFTTDKFYIDEVLVLNSAIQMIAYCMRIRRKECYNEIDKDYFTYNSVMYENI